MSKFSKTRKKIKKSSCSIDEKITYLNKELKKTGMLDESGPANSTSNMYTKTQFVPYIPATMAPVPDSSGVTDPGWTQPGDETDTDTWDEDDFDNTTLYKDTSYLYNPNTLNGEANREILQGVDPALRTAAGSPAGGGIAINGNYYGVAIGYVGGGQYHGVLSGGLTGGTNAPTEASRGYGGSYRGLNDAQFAHAVGVWNAWYGGGGADSLYMQYYAGTLTTKSVRVWVPYNYHHHYQRGGNYATWSGGPKSGGKILETVAVIIARNEYQDQDTEHARTIVLQRISLGDPNHYPGDAGAFLSKLLDVGNRAWDYLKGKAGKLKDYTLDDLDKRWNRLNNQIDKFVDDVGEIADEVRDLWNGVQDGRHLLSNVMATIQAAEMSNSIDENGQIKSEAQGSPQNPIKNEVRDSTAKDIIHGIDWSQNPPVAYDQFGKPRPIGQQIQDNVSAAPWEDGGNIGAKGTHNNLPNYGDGTSNTPAPYVNEDGDLIIPDTFHFGPGGHETKWLPRATRATIDAANRFAAGHDGNTTYQGGNLISDEQRKEADEEARTIMDQSLGIFIPNIPGRKDPVVYFQTVIPAEQLNRIKGKQKTNESYLKEDISDVSLAWASPKHVSIDKNERKRWYDPKDIQPLHPKKENKIVNGYHADSKIAPKKESGDPFIKISETDILRNHKLSDHEKKEWTDTINAINEFLAAHPEELIHARQRYPKSDPKLAELNWTLDQMLGASDEYMDSHFPENTRLFNKLQKATKKTAQLTDPEYIKRNYNEIRGTIRTVNDFNEYGSGKTEKISKINRKSPSRFFKKPKKKSASDIIDERIRKLEKDSLI